MNPTQHLAQQVSQKYGWSTQFEAEQDGYWVCHVTLGIRDTRKFSSDCPSTAPSKQGIAAASQAALDGLEIILERQKSKPIKELTEVFPLLYSANERTRNQQRYQIRGSSPLNWKEFIWDRKPRVVGIDTEGNQTQPPILVQIATEDCVLLEIPSLNTDNQLSPDLQRLLQDDSIVKVFCDNFAHRDKVSLGILKDIPKGTTSPWEQFSAGPVVDLESMATHLLGPVKVARGLSRIVTLVMPELDNIIIGKTQRFRSISRFALIEQGKTAPLRSLRDLSKREKEYAALDAWITLQAYMRMQEHMVGRQR